MKLQNIVFPSPETCTIEEMYMRRNGRVNFSWAESVIELKKNASIYLDTYFNGFSIGKWKKYTKIKNVYVTLQFSGKMRITLIQKERIGHEVLNHYIKEEIIESEGEEITLCFGEYLFSGILTIDLFAVSNTSFYGGYYWTNISEDEIETVKLAIDICTFRRESFVKKNINLIKKRIFETKKYDNFQENLEIFIIDNAQTLRKEDFCEKYIHIIPNKNVGGSGGFTRGLIEIKDSSRESGFTHALLMDDDIVIEPDSIFRSWSFLRLIKPEYKDAFIGGAMLRLDHQYIQVECGAVWNQGELLGRKSGLDLRGIEPCLYNEVEESLDYSAWWYTVLPLDIVKDDNLPLPIFIRGDDVEYGLRNARQIITMNGICVWHEPFENKYSSPMFYYILRNRLIDNAVHKISLPKKDFLRIVRQQVMGEIYLYRYKNARLLMQGIEDYLKGIGWFLQQKGDELHTKVINAGYKMQYIEDAGGYFDYGLYEKSFQEPVKTSLIHKVLKRLTINGIRLKPERQKAVIPLIGCKEVSVYRVEQVVNYDALTQKGFVTRRDVREAKECIAKLKKIKKLVRVHYDSVNEEYFNKRKELMDKGFWIRYLE